MKLNSICFLFAVVAMLLCSGSIWAQCPEDPDDPGECDTLHVVPWSDTLCEFFPCFVHVPLLVTHDLTQSEDSIVGFVIPLRYAHTNPSAYCSLSYYWNTTGFWGPPAERSIYRHFGEMQNRMMELAEQYMGEEWDTSILELCSDSCLSGDSLTPPHFFLTIVPTGSQDQRWWEGHRILLATITFKISDTMHVCIDTTLWPPSNTLKFSDYRAMPYVPRHNMPLCFKVDTVGNGSAVQQLEGSENGRPEHFFLSQNYPNPFNPVTNIEFSLSKSAWVSLEIFNILGQKVKTLIADQNLSPGAYLVDWDGKDENGHDVSSGIYFYRIQAGDFSEVKKMIFLK